MCKVQAVSSKCSSTMCSDKAITFCRKCEVGLCRNLGHCGCGQKTDLIPPGCQGRVTNTDGVDTVCGDPIKYFCSGDGEGTTEMFLCEVCVTSHTKILPANNKTIAKVEPYLVPFYCERCHVERPNHFDATAQMFKCQTCKNIRNIMLENVMHGPTKCCGCENIATSWHCENSRYCCNTCKGSGTYFSLPNAASYPIIQINADIVPLANAAQCQGITESSEERFVFCGDSAVAKCQRCGNTLCKVCKSGHGGDMCNPPRSIIGVELYFTVKRVVWSQMAQMSFGNYGRDGTFYTIDNPNLIFVKYLHDFTPQDIQHLPDKAVIFVEDPGMGELHPFSCLAADQKKNFVVIYLEQYPSVLPTKVTKIDFQEKEIILYTNYVPLTVVAPVEEDTDTQLDITLEAVKDEELDKQVEQVFSEAMSVHEQIQKDFSEELREPKEPHPLDPNCSCFLCSTITEHTADRRITSAFAIFTLILLLFGMVAVAPFIDQPVQDAVQTAYKVYSSIINYPEVP